MSRRLLSIMLFITILVGLLPAVAQGELYVDRYEIQYATGEVDGEGDPLYELAIPGVDILTPVLLDDGRLWIQTLNGFWQDPVRVFAMVVKDGVTEMIPFTDAFGSEWLSLSDGGAFATAFRLTVDGMPYMESGIVLSSQPPESVPLSWDDTPPENPAPENVSLYAPNEPPAADNGWGYVDNTPNNPEPEPQNWYEPPANAENNVLVRQNSLLMNESAFAIPNNASAVIEAQLPDPPEYENPFGRSTAETVLYHPDHPTMPIGNMPEDTKFIVNEAPGGGLLYARDGEGKVLISVTSLDGLWNGYILADAAEFWSKADEDSYRRFLWESSLQTPPENRTSDYGRITVANAMLYAGVTGAGVTTLPSGTTMVYSGSYDYDADGNLWLAVRSHDASLSGYIPYSAFAFYDAQGERNYLESLKEKLPADSKNAYGRITAANAELFSNIGVSTGTFLPFGNVVMLNGSEKHDANGKLYVPVKSEDGTRTGYIKMSDFRFMNDAERIAYDASKQPAPPQPQPMPDRQTDYAYIKSVGATLYDRSGRQIGVFAGNTAVEYLKNAQDPTYVNDSTGKRYLLVKADVNGGAQGYVQADSLDFMTTREKSSYDKEKEAANKPAVTEDALQPGVSRYGYVLSNNINVLKLPGSGGDLVTRVNTDEVVLVTEEVIGTNSTPYYHIMLEDKAGKPQGYILKTYVRLMTSQEQARYIASLSSGSKTNPPTPVTQVSGYYRVSASYALMMPFEDIGASPIAALKAGDVVYVYKQVYDKSNNLFHYAYISATNQWGYILASSLMPMSPQEVGNYFKTTPPTAAPAQTYSPSAYSGYAILTSNSINFRSGASVNSKALTQLKQNTIVRVLEQLQSEGATWYKCESGGITGYIRGDLLSLLTISQYMSYMTTPSYNQGGNIITPTATVKPANITSNTWATPRPNQTITFVTIPPLFAVSPAPTLDPFATPTPDPFATPTPTATVEPIPSPPPGELFGDLLPTSDPDATLLPPAPAFPTENSGFSPPGLLLALVVLLVIVAGGLYGYSVYNKARRKQSQVQAKRLADEKRRAQAQQGENGAKPAVRRPVPPTTPPGAPAKPGAPAAQAKPGVAGAQAKQETQAKPAANPYMRPQGQAAPRQPGVQIQDVTSPLPRAQVDGKPVNGTAAKPPETPAAPAGETAKPVVPAPQNPYARPPQAPAAAQRPIMPVAPPPVEPDHEDPTTPTPRRRRRPPENSGAQNTGPKDEA